MRVMMVSTSFPANADDWRGIFISHLVVALARLPMLHLMLWAPPGKTPSTVETVMLPAEATWLRKLMAAGGISHLMRALRADSFIAPVVLMRMIHAALRRRPDVDVYHINWLQCALPLPANTVPALISVLGNDIKLLKLPLVKRLLRRSMRNRHVTLCPNALWMGDILQEAFGDIARVIHVPFGIDPCWYAICRKRHSGKNVWVAVTRLTSAKLGDLFEWSEPFFRDGERELHLFGPMQEQLRTPAWIHYHGAVSPDTLADAWFPIATGLISLSRHSEGRPQVMLEALASGLPVVASALQAHREIVENAVTGYVCDSCASFGAALIATEDGDNNRRLGDAARAWARKEVGTWDDCAVRYERIYRSMIGGRE